VHRFRFNVDAGRCSPLSGVGRSTDAPGTGADVCLLASGDEQEAPGVFLLTS
jgi:hypothetical protein